MKPKLLFQGAEAHIFLSNNQIIKERKPKSYRLPLLDNKIRYQRTKKESRLLEKASKVIPIPKIISVTKDTIVLERIKGKKLSDNLDKLPSKLKVCKQIGINIAKLHDTNIIHGDLTTSNMILSPSGLYFIDFGLGFESSKIEDKATDIHLIKQALEAKHFKQFKPYFSQVIKGYKASKNVSLVLKRLEAVEKRGRYKGQY